MSHSTQTQKKRTIKHVPSFNILQKKFLSCNKFILFFFFFYIFFKQRKRSLQHQKPLHRPTIPPLSNSSKRNPCRPEAGLLELVHLRHSTIHRPNNRNRERLSNESILCPAGPAAEHTCRIRRSESIPHISDN